MSRWFVLNHIVPNASRQSKVAQSAVDTFNTAEGTSLRLFAPTIVKVISVNGHKVKREMPLTYQYVFVRGDFEDVKRLCGMTNGFSFLLNHGSDERYVTISDHMMDDFRRIANAYSNTLPFFALDDIDLESGDKVEIVEGSFPGLVGTFIPKAKSNSGDIVLAVSQNLGTVIYDVKAKYVRVLEFSSKSKRSYDQIDAFVPRLYKALRAYASDERLDDRDISALTVFCRRMGVVKLDNHKLEARLLAMLLCASRILGRRDEAERMEARLSRRLDAVTSPWTMAMTDLLLGVTDRSEQRLAEGFARISGLEADTKSRRQLADEYEFHLENARKHSGKKYNWIGVI